MTLHFDGKKIFTCISWDSLTNLTPTLLYDLFVNLFIVKEFMSAFLKFEYNGVTE